jgi:type I restriction enzyme S subunit
MNKLVKLKDTTVYSNKRVNSMNVNIDCFITTDNMLQNKAGITIASNMPYKQASMPAFSPHNILVANIRPYLKKIWFSNKSGGCSPDVLVFEVNEQYDPKYIYYSIFRDEFFEHMMRGSKGTKMPRGDKNQIQEFLIPDYEFSTQQKIASVLSALDSKIELNHKINAELEAMAKTLYDYWFVQFDFPDENGKPYKSSGGKMIWNNELKRYMPYGWEVHEIEEFCRIFTGKKDVNQALKSGKYKFFSCSPDYKFSNEKLYEGKAILISGNGSYTGRTIFIDEGFDLYQRTYACVNNNETDILPYLYYSILRFLSLKINGGTHGSAIPYIVYNDIAKEKFSYNQEVIVRFQKIINPMLIKIKNIDNQTTKLANLRDWLLPMLMNGQIKVK